MPSSLQSTPRQHFTKEKKHFSSLEESPRIHFGQSNPVHNHSTHSHQSVLSMKPIDTSYKGLFDDVLGEDDISDVESETESVNIPIQETKHKQPSTPKIHSLSEPSNNNITHKHFKLIEDRFEKLEQLVFTIQKETKESVSRISIQLREDVDSVRNYATKLIDTSLKNYHKNFESILEQYSVNSTPLKGNLVTMNSSPSKSLANNSTNIINTSIGGLRESSAYLEQLKAELEMKVASSVREVEERIQGRITDVDYRFNQSIATLHKCVDEKLERQQKVIGRMTEEQRWIEEEGIKLRVEHEAKVENMIKTIKSDLELMVSESKQSVTDAKSSLSQKYNAIEKRVDDLQRRFHFEEENRQLLNTLTRSTQHLPNDATFVPVVSTTTSNEGVNSKRGSSLRSSPSSTKGSSTMHHRSPNSNDNLVDPTHYNMIQALLSKSKEVLERNHQGATSPSSTTSSQRSHSNAYRPSTPAEREF